MSDIISQLTPLNLQEEKKKFFADTTYNPQLKYARDFTTEELSIWGKPIPSLVKHSKKMLQFLPHFPVNETYVTQEYVLEKITEFNERYFLPTKMTAIFSENMVTRCRVDKNIIYLQLPVRYTKEKLADLFRHELETHVLRSLNNQQQSWKSSELNGISFRKTEEGLAGLHTHLFREDKHLRKSYTTYLAISVAQSGSFSDVFQTMIQHKVSPQIAWNIALRTKRGITDTSMPGGLTKDISYLEGSVLVWKWLMNPKNNVKNLYIGRIGLADVDKLFPIAKREHLIYPHFIEPYEQYLKNIKEIGEVNSFSSLDLDQE